MRKFQIYSGNIVLSGNDSSKVGQNGKILTRSGGFWGFLAYNLLREARCLLKDDVKAPYGNLFLGPSSLWGHSFTGVAIFAIDRAAGDN